MNDQRLDGLLRSVLDHEAERLASLQPILPEATDRLAHRLLHAALPRPIPLGRALPGGHLPIGRVLLVALVVSALIAAAIAGAMLLRPRHTVPNPGPFLFGAPCEREYITGQGLLLYAETFTSGEEFEEISLRDSGLLVRGFAGSSLTVGPDRLPEISRPIAIGRRLSPQGVARLMDRVADSGVTPGCQEVRTSVFGGHVLASLPDGPARIWWGPFPDPEVRSATADREHEQAAAALLPALIHPEAWLPASAFIDPVEREFLPERWVLVTIFAPTDLPPGAVVTLGNGDTLSGADPRYGRVALPGATLLEAFGEEILIDGQPARRSPWSDMTVGTISSQRCGTLTPAELDTLRRSLQGVHLGTDAFGDLFSEDLSHRIKMVFTAELPGGRGCEGQAEGLRRIAQETDHLRSPSPPPLPTGDVAHLNPCEFLPDDIDQIVGSYDPSQIASPLPIGVRAWACAVSGMHPESGWRLTLYPWLVDAEGASRLVDGVIGTAAATEDAAGHPIWLNDCLAFERDCRGLAAIYLDPYFLVLEAPRDPPRASHLEAALTLTEAIAAATRP